MDDQGRDVVGSDAETITDIQNYLASFNKEIQDGGAATIGSNSILHQAAESTGIVESDVVAVHGDEAQVEEGQASATATGPTYYVTQNADGMHLEGFQYTSQGQAQYDGTTFYTPTEGGYYAAAEPDQEVEDTKPQFDTLPAYAAALPDTGGKLQVVEDVDEKEARQGTHVALAPHSTFHGMAVGGSHIDRDSQIVTSVSTSEEEHGGLQQIVLAVSEAQGIPVGENVDTEAREISVTIPASMTTQVGHVHEVNHESTEALLQAVESHRGAEVTDGSDQPTFVAMQPGSSHEVHSDVRDSQQVVAVADPSQGLATLIRQAEAMQEQGAENAAQVMAHPQTIRMVLRQPDGTETEQTIPVSGAGGSTLVTSDGQEIHVSDEGTLQMMANLAEQAAASGSADGSNQVILNTGNSYQTVTIVPSDTNPGEVSYVLIVSQHEDGKDGAQKGVNLDMSVYDFNEGEKHGEVVAEETGPDGTKMRTIKITPKKSQTVTQAHMCNYCNYTSPKRYLLSRHMKSHSEERPHKCSVCERGFKTLASLQNHVNTHTGTRPHQCKECEAAFTTSGELVRHVRYKHTHEKPHRCTECDYASVELSKLKRHMRCHTGERPYQCPHCTYASPDTYKLKRHLRIHTGEKPYECDVCHARFTQSNSLKAHKMIHSGNKPIFQCDLCPTTCGRKTDLRIHVQKLHTSDKPLKCKRCGKSFPDRYTYKVHVKTHEGEKCFKCDLCPYASISQRHLESHMLIHTDQKPFRCDECDQAFRQKQLLKRHKNLYHDPNYIPPVPKEKTHECPECGKAFRHKGNLIRHLAVHDPEATAAERAEAMRIGQPKGPGEQPDGEEDDYDGEDEEIDDSLGVDESMQDEHEGQQVVVFEVIQLPAAEDGDDQHTVSALAHGAVAVPGEGGEGVTIIQQVQASSLADEVAAAVAQVHGKGGVAQVVASNQSLEELAGLKAVQQAMAVANPLLVRRRGRPRKYPLPVDAHSINAVVERDGEVQEHVMEEQIFTLVQDQQRKRKLVEVDENATEEGESGIESNQVAVLIPNRKGRPPKTVRIRSVVRTNGEEVQEETDDLIMEAASIEDPAALARREAEIVRKRLEQKQKDMAECFGFNDDDEDEDTILAMPAAPGVQAMGEVNTVVQTISANGSEEGGKGRTTLQLLTSLHQNGATS